MKKRIVLTGATGFLGWNLLSEGRDQQWLLPITRSEFPVAPPSWVEEVKCLSMESPSSLLQQLKHWKPGGIIHTLAISDAKTCEEQLELSELINVEWPVSIAKVCREMNIPFVHCSSDLVFDGEKGNYAEEEQTQSLSAYGRQKRRSETKVLSTNPEAWVVRLPLLYGESGAWTKNGFRGMADTLKQGGQLKLFTDEYRTPARGRNIARFLLNNIGQQRGIMNLGGKERLSRYEMGCAMISVLGGNENQISALRQEDLDLGAPRPRDVSLNSDLAFGLGYKQTTFMEELQDIQAGGGWVRESF